VFLKKAVADAGQRAVGHELYDENGRSDANAGTANAAGRGRCQTSSPIFLYSITVTRYREKRIYGRPDARLMQASSASSRVLRQDAQCAASAALLFGSSPGTKVSRMQTAPTKIASQPARSKTPKQDSSARWQSDWCDRDFEAFSTQQLPANISQPNKFVGQPRRLSPRHQQRVQPSTSAASDNRRAQSVALVDSFGVWRQEQPPSLPGQQQPPAFKTMPRPLATIDLTKDFVPPEQRLHLPAAIRRSASSATPLHTPGVVPVLAYTKPSAAVASSLSVSEISFLSPEAEAEAMHARNEYIRNSGSSSLHPNAMARVRRSAARARPLFVPESSPRQVGQWAHFPEHAA
jgi:hypothetical protein